MPLALDPNARPHSGCKYTFPHAPLVAAILKRERVPLVLGQPSVKDGGILKESGAVIGLVVFHQFIERFLRRVDNPFRRSLTLQSNRRKCQTRLGFVCVGWRSRFRQVGNRGRAIQLRGATTQRDNRPYGEQQANCCRNRNRTCHGLNRWKRFGRLTATNRVGGEASTIASRSTPIRRITGLRGPLAGSPSGFGEARHRISISSRDRAGIGEPQRSRSRVLGEGPHVGWRPVAGAGPSDGLRRSRLLGVRLEEIDLKQPVMVRRLILRSDV